MVRDSPKAHNAHYDRPNTLSLVAGDLTGQSVLDAGCGPGFYAEELAKRGATVTAVDAVDRFVEMTRDRLKGEKHHRVFKADLTQALPCGEAEFDLVLSALVIHYVADFDGLFREFFRVLKPGGLVVLSCGHPMADWLYMLKKEPESNYFDSQLFTEYWGGFGDPKPAVTSYRRPFAAIFNPFIKAGLNLDHLLEARPAESMKTINPQLYDKMNVQPNFIMLRLKKPL